MGKVLESVGSVVINVTIKLERISVPINYEVEVEGIEIDGHPITVFASNLHVASTYFDFMVKKYPYNKVILKELVVKELKTSIPAERPLRCLRGCTGNIDGRPVVRLGSNDKAYCTICSWREI